MNELRSVTGKVAVLDRADVDTDQIIPKQFLKRIERSGYGQFLFFDWVRDPDFFLNDPENRDAPILIAGRNFGCGSSREHAAWALEDFGFRVVIAPSFGDIFRANAILSGLAPVQLPPEEIARIREALTAGKRADGRPRAPADHASGRARSGVRVRCERPGNAGQRSRRRGAHVEPRRRDHGVRGDLHARASTRASSSLNEPDSLRIRFASVGGGDRTRDGSAAPN